MIFKGDIKMDKKVLLIGGGGTIGTYVAKELLEKGCYVDIICLEDYVSDNEKLRYIKAEADYHYLANFIESKYYDGIVNFLHYRELEDYTPIHKLLAPRTGHIFFISSIRAIGDEQHPVTETAPLIYELAKDENYVKEHFNTPQGEFLLNVERYSLSKAWVEEYLHKVDTYKNWTIIRPMINTSDKRFDIVTNTFHDVIKCAKEGKSMDVPEYCRYNIAGLEWAGNTGKMIANLMFKKECMCETYNLSTAHRMTWNDVANIYTEFLGVKFNWIPNDEFKGWSVPILYDRGYNRDMDNAKLLRDTGLTPDDFTPFKEGVELELRNVGVI